jgi:hypothetical protein
MTVTTDSVRWAEHEAFSLLAPLGNRWLHTKGVVAQAQHVGKAFDQENCAVLLAAAYLHDIGYAPSLQRTGFHPLDGAHYLLAHGQTRLASLVAYHSESQCEAHLRGLTLELTLIPCEDSATAAALTYCDMITSPTGLRIPFEERLANIFQRYDQTHIVYQAIHQAVPLLTQAVNQTQQILYQYEPKGSNTNAYVLRTRSFPASQ